MLSCAARAVVAALVLATAAAAAGCATSMRLGVGPSVDTAGRPGFEVRISGAIGPGNELGGVMLGAYGGAGLLGDAGNPAMLSVGGEVEGMIVLDDGFVPRGALLVGARGTYGPEPRTYGALGLELGLGYALHLDRRCREGVPFLIPSNCTRHAVMIGIDVRSEYLWGPEDRGLFTFPIVLEWFYGL